MLSEKDGAEQVVDLFPRPDYRKLLRADLPELRFKRSIFLKDAAQAARQAAEEKKRAALAAETKEDRLERLIMEWRNQK